MRRSLAVTQGHSEHFFSIAHGHLQAHAEVPLAACADHPRKGYARSLAELLDQAVKEDTQAFSCVIRTQQALFYITHDHLSGTC